MTALRRLLPVALVFGLAGSAGADHHDQNLWVSVVEERTGYPVHSDVEIYLPDLETDSYKTDGCGNLAVDYKCDRKLKFEAKPREVNYYKSKPQKCRARGNRPVQNLKIKVRKNHSGKKQLIHRSKITATVDGSEYLYWYEYEWVAAAVLSQKDKKCNLKIDVRQRFMDITDEDWDREYVRALDESFPEHFKRKKKEWRVVIPCSNVRTVQDIIAGRYELFVNEFKSRMEADRKSFIKILGGTDSKPMSCAKLVSETNR